MSAPEDNEAKEKTHQAEDTLRRFISAQEITKDNADIFETFQAGGMTIEVLEFVADQARKEITELSRLEDPSQRQTAIEKARRLKDVTAAYKLIKEQKYG